MKKRLTDLRREAALHLIAQHPEVSLIDIGAALGFRRNTARSLLSSWANKAGMRRKRGAASPAYFNPAEHKIDREKLKRLLDTGISYGAAAKKMKMSYDSLKLIARRLGYSRPRGKVPRVPDLRIKTWMRLHPEKTNLQVKRHFSYKSFSLWERLARLRKEIKEEACAS